jgi:hypothetical protein
MKTNGYARTLAAVAEVFGVHPKTVLLWKRNAPEVFIKTPEGYSLAAITRFRQQWLAEGRGKLLQCDIDMAKARRELLRIDRLLLRLDIEEGAIRLPEGLKRRILSVL